MTQRELSNTLTRIEISAPDSPGVFYRFCMAFARLGWDIQSARVSTWKGEARSGFYVVGCGELSDEQICDALLRAMFTI
jgi:UTP:GlnB (protein PII) uridylyltransferase